MVSHSVGFEMCSKGVVSTTRSVSLLGSALRSSGGGLVFGTGCQLASTLPSQRRQEERMAPTNDTQQAVEEPVVEEMLVEEVSIDGMCGVY
ncbi:mycofactocin precursor [Pseudonocardia sp. MH-G8]|nr:mycofactocin precursor [Pseudonocardia sp. MH-G8]